MRLLSILLLLYVLTIDAEAAEPLSKGQTVYVPVYSHVQHGNLDSKGRPEVLLLSSMLSIRNVDPDHGITVSSVRYYDTAGKLLREYLPAPLALGPLGSTDVFVEHKDSLGGTGANFMVDWNAETPASAPLLETVNAYFFGAQSGVFTSRGVAVKERD
jgi:hypothetical protein